ncbi:MAG TPA: ribonuclease P protein component [Kofleriaceae bacterium]|nr:ribonuclease P protein component [Kofleriaceae bacterium]
MTKSMRLRRRDEFVRVQSTGRKVHGRHFVALVAPSETGTASPSATGRVGLTVTKRIGNAVTRNRIKRAAREWLRRHGWVPAGHDVVFIAKETAAEHDGAELGADLGRVTSRLAMPRAS